MAIENVNARFLRGFVFVVLGVAGLSVAMACYFNFDSLLAHGSCVVILWPFFLTFAGIFGLLSGMYALYVEICHTYRIRNLIEHGIEISAQVVAPVTDWSVQKRGKPTYRVLLSYREHDGRILQFKSRNLEFNPAGKFTSDTCRVYLNPNVDFEDCYGVFVDENHDFCHYYVDIESVLG